MNSDWIELKNTEFQSHRLNLADLFEKYRQEASGNMEEAMSNLAEFLDDREESIKKFIDEAQIKFDESINPKEKLNFCYDIQAAKILQQEITKIIIELSESMDGDQLLIDMSKASKEVNKATEDSINEFENRLRSIQDTIEEIQYLNTKKMLSPDSHTISDSNALFMRKVLIKDASNTPELKLMAQLIEKFAQDEYKRYSELKEFCDLALRTADKAKSPSGSMLLTNKLNSVVSHIDKFKSELLKERDSLNNNFDSARKENYQKIVMRQQIVDLAIKKIDETQKIIADPKLSKDYHQTVTKPASTYFKPNT
jgi:hypothetical protein